MPSPIPRRSESSAGAVYLDREARLRELEEMARRAARQRPEIRRVLLFGSLATGIPTPRSDADLLIEVAESPWELSRDRIPEILLSLRPLPCPIDLHVYTTAELAAADSPLVRTALRDGRDLLSET